MKSINILLGRADVIIANINLFVLCIWYICCVCFVLHVVCCVLHVVCFMCYVPRSGHNTVREERCVTSVV